MRRFMLLAVVLIVVAVPVVWWISRPSPGVSVFRDYVPQSLGKTWTITGSPGSKHLAFVDPTGAIQPRRGSYSIHWFVYDRDKHKLYSPLLHNVRARAGLYGGFAPSVNWQADGIKWHQTVFASADTCYSSVFVGNASRDTRHISVFAAAVPYQVIGPMQSRADVKCDIASRSIVVDGKVLLTSERKPNDAASAGDNSDDITCYIRNGVLPDRGFAHGTFVGLSSGAMRYDFRLKPGSDAELYFRMPMTEVNLGEWNHARRVPLDRALAEINIAWNDRWRPIGLKLPDRRVLECFKASIAYLVMLSADGTPKPGPAKYRSFWVRDAAYMADALYYAGQRGLIPPALAQIQAMQLPSGGFLPKTKAAQDNELDAPGEAIYALIQQYRRTGDMRWLRDVWPGILSACRYIRAKRVTSGPSTSSGYSGHPSGILPASVSAEDLGKGDQQHYWDDFWCVRGLRDAVFAARKLGKAKDAAWIEAEADSLLCATLASVRKVMAPQSAPHYIPNGPQDLASSAMARGTSCALWPCAVLDPTDALTRDSFDCYWRMWIAPFDGGFVHKGHYWPYAGLDLAQGYLMLGQRERAWKMLDWTLDHDPTRGFYSWPEGMSMKDGGLAEGDMPHGWMCAAYVSLVRNMLVRESGRDLVLLSGVPRQWLKPGALISVRHFPTEFGTVSYSAEVSQNGLKLQFSGAKPAVVCRVILPGNREAVIPANKREATIPLR